MLHAVSLSYLSFSPVFRWIHIEHHANLGLGKKDPDYFIESKSMLEAFLKSFVLFLHYNNHFSKCATKYRHRKMIIFLTMMIPVAVCGLSFLAVGSIMPLIISWIAPAFIGVGILAFVDTVIPHAFHARQDRGSEPKTYANAQQRIIENTLVIEAPRAIEWFMGFQNYHLVHHLRPTLPWFEYKNYWIAHQDLLSTKNAKTVQFQDAVRKSIA